MEFAKCSEADVDVSHEKTSVMLMGLTRAFNQYRDSLVKMHGTKDYTLLTKELVAHETAHNIKTKRTTDGALPTELMFGKEKKRGTGRKTGKKCFTRGEDQEHIC